MAYSVRLSELYKMPEEERESALDKLVEAAYGPPNGQLEDIETQIGEFEVRYEVSSGRMMEELRKGKRKETADIASWLMLLRLRENFGLPKPA